MNRGKPAQRAWLLSMNSGRESFQRGHMNDAISAFTQATKLLPGRVEGWVNLGSALLEGRRFEESVVALDKAVALNPKLMAAHMLLGDAFRQLGEKRLAVACYRTAVSLQRQPLALNKLACALRVDGHLQEAEQLYQEALHSDANFTLAKVNLATLQIERGRHDEAHAQLQALAACALPPAERDEVRLSLAALSEYIRLAPVLSGLAGAQDLQPLQAALSQTPQAALGVDTAALRTVRAYVEFAQRQPAAPEAITGAPPPNWPLIEALFMIPLAESVDEFLALQAQLPLEHRQSMAVTLRESLNMETAVHAARASRAAWRDPVAAEAQLRHWHALACRDLEGFLPGHFKYTQNWSTRSPLLKRVEPALASGTVRHFVADIYAGLPPGLLRAAIVFMAVCDLHPFADGNGRVAMLWLNRELEWAGLMPAVFSRERGLKGELGRVMHEVRTNGGDLSPLLAAITRAQREALAFCQALAQR